MADPLQMDDTADDPRAFHATGLGLGGEGLDDGVPPGMDTFLRMDFS